LGRVYLPKVSFNKFSAVVFILLSVAQWQSAAAQRVGLVLSGGGARGIAHIGVIKALEENHIPIDYIAGTSAGAIIGNMYAQGLSPQQMDSIVHTDEFYNWANGIIDEDYTYYFRKREDNASWITLKFSVDSIVQTSLPTNIVNSAPVDYALMANTASVIAKANYNFDSLFIPFRCVASDIENKQTVIFRNGDLGTAVRASSAFPFYFKPIMYEGKILYDGGMYNNFPADVMLTDFQPDIILGVNASGSNTPTTEGNIISQIRTMMTTPTNFSVLCDNGILINVNTDKYGLFDFNRITELINEGYQAAMHKMDTIKFNIQRRVDAEALEHKRQAFRSDLGPVVVDNVSISGINSKQQMYVASIIKQSADPLPIEKLKSRYFQLVADENVKTIFPTLKYNYETKMYDLHLRMTQQRDLITQFGGVLASRPISEAFVSAQYNLWSKRAYSFSGNFYFGRLYTSGQVKVRMDSPAHFPYFLESEATINQYDFYKSSTALLTDEKPSYILKSDYNFGLNLGIPARNKGKVVLAASYLQQVGHYYQTSNFLQKDTADESNFKGVSSSLLFERNTLNRKQYANQGTFLSLRLRYFYGNEYTIPGSTSVDRTETKDARQWFQFRVVYDNYYKRRGRLKLGFFAQGVFSDQPFFANYTSTVLSAPVFQPVQEMQTLFLSNFHAHTYAAAGLRNVVAIKGNLDFRLEGFVFQPYREIEKTEDLKSKYGKIFERRYYIGSGGLVFHSPVGPVSLFVNYYHERKNPFSVLFHIGYIIFNKSALD
jgi:NTE family protein